MAARDSQGLQIGLIVTVMFSIALLIACYVLFRSADEASAKAQAAEDSLNKANEIRDTSLLESQELKKMLGYDIGAKLDEITTNFEQDMKLFGADVPPSDPKHYRTLSGYLLSAINSRHAQVVDGAIREKTLQKEKDDAEAREIAKRDAAIKAQQAAVATLADERTKFNTGLEQFKSETARLEGELSKKQKENSALVSQLSKKTTELLAQIDTKEKLIRGLREKVEGLTPESFDIADGKITWVNQAEETVWVNLGFADGLNRQITFSVYDRDDNTRTADKIKGEIEIIRIRDAHLSEAKIVGSSVSNPILPDDLLFTPAWTPGSPQRFAFTGVLDINHDGKSTEAEHNLIRNLIAINNGVIDAEMLPDGKVTGDMSINTRYLVDGDAGPEGSTSERIMTARTDMTNAAAELGVKKIPLDQFLTLMGYRRSARSIPLGTAANADDFKAKPPGGGSRFRPRSAPTRGAKGAY